MDGSEKAIRHCRQIVGFSRVEVAQLVAREIEKKLSEIHEPPLPVLWIDEELLPTFPDQTHFEMRIAKGNSNPQRFGIEVVAPLEVDMADLARVMENGVRTYAVTHFDTHQQDLKGLATIATTSSPYMIDFARDSLGDTLAL